MKDIQNSKTPKMVGIAALVLAVICFAMGAMSEEAATQSRLLKMGFILLAATVILIILALQTQRRKKRKGNRYHSVHWDNGHIKKDN